MVPVPCVATVDPGSAELPIARGNGSPGRVPVPMLAGAAETWAIARGPDIVKANPHTVGRNASSKRLAVISWYPAESVFSNIIGRKLGKT